MIKEYIGARYIPIFHRAADGSAAWELSASYEPLEIVLYNNNTYVSRQAVPANTPITNTEYWVKTADYNAQIAYILDKIENIEDKKVIFIGDSYSYGTRATGDLTGWPEIVANYIGLSQNDFYKLPYSQAANPDGSASTPGFYPTSGTHKSFKTMLELLTASLTDDIRGKITDIVVCGGYNDNQQSYDTVISGIESFANYAKLTYPKAKLHCGFIAWDFTSGAVRQSLLYTIQKAYRDSVKYGFNYIDGADSVMHNKSLMSDDNIHPTLAGLQEISKHIANVLKGNGPLNEIVKYTANVTSPDGSITLGGNAIGIANNDTISFVLNSTRVLFTAPKTRAQIGSGIVTFIQDLPVFNPVEVLTIPTIAILFKDAGYSQPEIVPAFVEAQGNQIKAFIAAIIPDNTYYGVTIASLNASLPRGAGA